MTSGVLGGLPVTGVIVRSSANVAAGARTRASAILHGVWLLLFALPFAGLIQLIPTAALAGLLIVIGCQLVKRAHIETARRTGDFAVYAVTLVGVVFLNLLEGVLIGLALAIALTVWRVVRAKIVAEPTGPDSWCVTVDGSCTFLSLPKLAGALATVPAGVHVTVELSVDFIDHAVHQTIDEWRRQHVATGGTVDVHDLGAVELVSAVSGPPVRGFMPFDKRSGVVPWSSWHQDDESTSVLHGLAAYHRRTAPVLRPHMQQLAHAQRPETLFITCTDSRIVPNVITSSGPGDLFTVRNVGNLIPAGQTDASMEAAIAFAVDRLHVKSVVVCGHSSCGAMNALLSDAPARSAGDEHLKAWLTEGHRSLEAFDGGNHPVARSAAAAGFGTVDQLAMVNIAVQVQTLREHPLAGDVEVIGLFYDIPTAAVLQVTPTMVETLADAA
jgi:carbonic anhydrase